MPPLAASCRTVALPAIVSGRSVAVFALENRAALHQANARIDGCSAFYASVRRDFGAE